MRRTLSLTLAAMLTALSLGGLASATAEEATPPASAPEATVRSFYDVFNSGDFAALDGVLSDDWASYPPSAGPGTPSERFRATVLAFRSAFPDLAVRVEEVVVEGDRVAVRSTMTGTHGGDFLGVPATGTAVTAQFIDVHRLEDGLIAESYHVEDLLGILVQIGAFPAAGSPPEDGTPTA